MFKFIRRFSKRRTATILVVLLAVLVLGGGLYLNKSRFSSKADTKKDQEIKSEEFVSNQLLIKLKEDGSNKLKSKGSDLSAENTGLSNIDRENKNLKAKNFKKVFKDNISNNKALDSWYVIEFSGDKTVAKQNENLGLDADKSLTMNELMMRYKRQKDIEYVEPNYIRELSSIPNDRFYSSQTKVPGRYDLWGLHKINAEQAWDKTTGNGVVVAVVDTGVYASHPDLAANMYKDSAGKIIGYDFVNNDTDADDDSDSGHGTHVAGTIAAVGNNDDTDTEEHGKKLVGVGYNLKIMPVKGFGATGGGQDDVLANCIRFAAEHGAQVINGSWGGVGDSKVIEDALKVAYDKGITSVFAAGNSNTDISAFYPAGSKYVITVGATNFDDKRSCFSNYGTEMDLLAPGGDLIASGDQACVNPGDAILSAQAHPRWTLYYQELRGTSMATPHVAGSVALIKALHPEYTPEEIRFALRNSTDMIDTGWNRFTTFGRLNVGNAVSLPSQPIALLGFEKNLLITRSNTAIFGTVKAKSGISKWTLSSILVSGISSGNWKTISSGSSAIEGGLLGNIVDYPDGGRYFLKLEVIDNTNQKSITYGNFSVDNRIYTGWPKELYQNGTQMALADLNKDGKDEIVFLDYFNQLNAVNLDGNSISGFPITIPNSAADDNYRTTGITIADVNLDNSLEIFFIAAKHIFLDQYEPSVLYVFSASGQLANSVTYGENVIPTTLVSIADINNDKRTEILSKVLKVTRISSDVKEYEYQLDIFDNNLKNLSKIIIPSEGSKDPYKSGLISLGDINNDKKLEIFTTGANYKIYGYDSNGNLISGWPKSMSHDIYGSGGATFADMNADGQKEVIGIVYNNWSPFIYVWDKNGNVIAANDGCGINTCLLSGNAKPLITNIKTNLFGIKAAIRSPLETCVLGIRDIKYEDEDQQYGREIKPGTDSILIDIDGDRLLEFLGLNLNPSNFPEDAFALDVNGKVKWSIDHTPYRFYSTETFLVGDLDGDKKIDVVGKDPVFGKVLAWKFDASTTDNTWRQFYRDEKHSGVNMGFFADVDATNQYYQYIMAILNQEITTGNNCPSTYSADAKCFFPDKNSTRQETAAFLARTAGLPTYAGTDQPFKDVPTTAPFYKEIMACNKAGIINGYPDGNFRPTENVNRAQLAVMIQRAKKYSYMISGQTFTDVPTGYWAYKEIESVNKAGIDTGCGASPRTGRRFCPETVVTRKEMAKWLYNAFVK